MCRTFVGIERFTAAGAEIGANQRKHETLQGVTSQMESLQQNVRNGTEYVMDCRMLSSVDKTELSHNSAGSGAESKSTVHEMQNHIGGTTF